MKPKFNSIWCLPALSVLCLAPISRVQAEAWTATTPNPSDWQLTTNWSPNSVPNGTGASAIFSNDIPAGTLAVNLNGAVTVGNLTLGDLTAATNGFFNIQNGTGGSLTFDASTGNATLQKTSGITSTDTISATTTLTDTLAADVRTGTIAITGLIGGGGGIIRSGSVSGAVTAGLPNNGAILRLTNNSNSYSGATTIEHGTLNAVLNGDVLASTNSVLGNSASAIVIGTAGFAPATASHNAQILRFSAGSDGADYTVNRGLDFSGVAQAGAGSVQLIFDGNGAGSANTNRLTLSGPITLGGSRSPTFNASRSGQTMDITGQISGVSSGNVTWGGFPAGVTSTDGRPGGTYRLSNASNSYANTNFLNIGTMIIAGSVGALNQDSPIGRGIIRLDNGSGGNIFGNANFGVTSAVNDTSPDSIRSVYLESAGTSFDRILNPGGGSNSSLALYGGNINVINGFQFGGKNTTGTTTFNGAITPANVNAGISATNQVTTAINMALIAQTGGTVEFTGGIGDTPSADTHARVTINQFRNNPHIDGMNDAGTSGASDGNADTFANNGANFTADRLVGTATGGTVVISGIAGSWNGTTEVLGGQFLVNSSIAGNTLTVASGATLGGSGTIGAGIVNSSTQINGTLAPGNSAGILTMNKELSFNAASIFSVELNGTLVGAEYDQLAANSAVSIDSTSQLLITLGFVPTAGDSFTLINLAGGNIGGTFGNLAEGGSIFATYLSNSYEFEGTYLGGTGNDLVLTAIPEPSAAMLMGGLGAIALLRRRRNI